MISTLEMGEDQNTTTSLSVGQGAAEPPAELPTPQPATASSKGPARNGKYRAGAKAKGGNRFRTPSKATASRVQDSRLPSARTGSVFDRLYKTQTVASKAWTPVRAQARRNKYSTPSKNTSTLVNESLQVFNRLHITGTVANSSKRVGARQTMVRTPTKKGKSPSKSIPSTHTPLRTPGSSWTQPNAKFVYSPRMKPLTKLYFVSKYHPGLGKEKVDPISLGQTFFQSFCEYENGGLTSEDLAREIILAFFKKDFPSSRHWELRDPIVEARAGDGHSFNVGMSATYEWEDGFRVASARGIVRCLQEHQEVRVLNYSYDMNSDVY